MIDNYDADLFSIENKYLDDKININLVEALNAMRKIKQNVKNGSLLELAVDNIGVALLVYNAYLRVMVNY